MKNFLKQVPKFLPKRVIRNVDGATITKGGRDVYIYSEKDHSMAIHAEMLMGETERVIYYNSIKKWLPPHETEIVSEEKRKEILGRLRKYFEVNGITYCVE